MARVKKESQDTEEQKQANELTLSRMEVEQDYKREPEVREENGFTITTY